MRRPAPPLLALAPGPAGMLGAAMRFLARVVYGALPRREKYDGKIRRRAREALAKLR